MRVLLIEDDPKLAGLVREGLELDAHQVQSVCRGAVGIDLCARQSFDVIVLDVMLPDLDGFTVCRRLRSKGVGTPVLMLTARDAIADRVAGLDAGADDYLVKPFAFAELHARLRALDRRGDAQLGDVLRVGDLRLDHTTRSVSRAGISIDLTAREFDLLAAFMSAPGRVFERHELLDRAWPDDVDLRSNVIDQYVRYLRTKVDEPFHTHSLETMRGVGYRLKAPHA